MKRGAFIFILVFSILLLSPMIFADELAQVEKAYTCLEGKTNGSKCATLTFDERVFSLLATGNCKNEVIADVLSDQCWPKAGCKIKSTAQAILALNKDTNTTKAENWLLSKTAVPSNIDWFLEIESNGVTSCTIIYSDQSTTYTLAISEEKKISSSNLGNCLSLAQDNYWLKIAPTCYNKEIRISCTGATNQGFITTLLFKNNDSSTVQVSENVHSASSRGTIIEKVETFCFSDDGKTCNYEGSLWAAFALYSSKRPGVSKFLPYLVTGMSSNSKFLPEAFLSFLTGEFGTDLLLKQKAQLYWEESGDKYYDTALALLPFRYESPYEKGYSKDWLLRVQGSDGCWNGGNIIDNAFILYSIWNKGTFDSGTCLFASNCIQLDCEVASCVGGVCLYDYSTICKDGDGCCNSGCTYSKDNDCEIGENECTSKGDCSYFDSTSDNYCSTDKTKVYQDVVEGSCKNRVCVKTETKKTIDTCASTDECNYGYCEAKDNSCETKDDCSLGQICDNGNCITPGYYDCKESNYFCMSSSKCPTNYLLGEEYSCSEGIFVCCSQEVEMETCSSQGGDICESNQGESCPLDGTTTPASDVSVGDICCIGALCQSSSEPCIPACLLGQTCADGSCITNTEYDCTDHKGICKSACGNKETLTSAYSCEYGGCCISKTTKSTLWIWILVILILLALLGILFRNKLKPFFFRLKSGMGGKKEKPSGPGMPMTHIGLPQHLQTRMMPRGIFPPSHPTGPRPLMRKPVGNRPSVKKSEESPKKGELDEVLKKLKEIGK